MKQEPVKKWKQPKYAALAAVLTLSAGMMTSCGNYSIQTEGTAPDPDAASGYTEPDIGGEVALEPDPADTTEIQTGTTSAQTEDITQAQHTLKILTQEEMQAWWDTYEPEPDLMGKVAPMNPVYQMYMQTTAPENTESCEQNTTTNETAAKETIS
ncbi:MAG: hypothetical protein J6S92_01115 [Oscillospiraceae bacterium]|nr:hypothetical protein [Oscillospiraceae bacterium]MBQ5339220.1 hypothetical protein [Oscillospiraceae bacterium]